MTWRRLKLGLFVYVLFDLLIGGYCGGLLPLSLLASAQFTTVTGTVTDPNGIPYANGTIVATLITTATPTFTATGFPYTPPTLPTGLSINGSFTLQLADNTQLSPAATKYNFTVCSGPGTVLPAGGPGPICFSLAAPITISGASQSITANLVAVAPALTFLASITNVKLPSLGVIGWNGDTGFSRTAATVIAVGNGTQGSTNGTLVAGSFNLSSGGAFTAQQLLIFYNNPTISSGFGTSPSISSGNGTANIRINVGTGGSASTGVIGLPTANSGWNCTCMDITTQNATVDKCQQIGAGTTTTVTIGNFTDLGVSGAWASGDTLIASCLAF
jgi:hypothetical protein